MNAKNSKRIYFLDNLRTLMIFLVVLLHTGLVYEKSIFSSMFWIAYDPASNTLAGPIRIVLDMFIMSVIFFISGYLAPISLKNKNTWQFIAGKTKRLMLPWTLAVLTLIPAYKFIYLYSRHLVQQDWTTYFHWSNSMWGQNWLWFLPVLFFFNIIYVVVAKLLKHKTIQLNRAIIAVFLLGLIFSMLMDIFNLEGWTKTFLLDFQNERLFIYVLMFWLGSVCSLEGVLQKPARANLLFKITIITVWLPVWIYYFFYTRTAVQAPAYFSAFTDSIIMWASFHLALLGILYVLIQTFRMYLNTCGKMINMLNKTAIHIYILHTIVLGGIAMLFLNFSIPSLAKYIIVTLLTFIANWIIGILYLTLKNKIIQKRKSSIMKSIIVTMLAAVLFITACSNEIAPVPQVDLQTAVITGDLPAIHQHIQAGTDLNTPEPTRGSTPLITAAVFGKTEIAQALIDAGADLNAQNNEGSTALITAAFFCRTEIVKALLEKNANTSIQNKAGRTAYDSVAGPFEKVKPMYDALAAALAPLGLQLDYDHIQAARPHIADMLQQQN